MDTMGRIVHLVSLAYCLESLDEGKWVSRELGERKKGKGDLVTDLGKAWQLADGQEIWGILESYSLLWRGYVLCRRYARGL